MSDAFLLDRLIDEIDRTSLAVAAPPWREILTNATKVRADNVAAYVREHWAGDRYDYPNVAPPWPKCWIEYVDPLDRSGVGMWCVAERNDDGWTLTVQCYRRPHSGLAEYLTTAHIYVDPLGKFIRSSCAIGIVRPSVCTIDPDAPPAFLVAPRLNPKKHTIATLAFDVDAALRDIKEARDGDAEAARRVLTIYHMHGELGEALREAQKRAAHIGHELFVYTAIHVLAMTFSFCHCKNVVRDEAFASYERTPPKRRKDHPSFRYHTLRIVPMRAASSRESVVSDSDSRRALHIRRGHFRTYVPERPLFGSIVGTFWVPLHVVGDAAHGVVAKEYAVEEPRP